MMIGTAVMTLAGAAARGRVSAGWKGGEETPLHRASHTAEGRGELFDGAERLGRTCGL